ncbi:NADH-quinone oxidoreductase subunit NuoE [Afifella sp. IM 167]|uniref:NADH-quinone oxidoreductase subunit NuoE n=1 Tax=Afifella sp. IM 167 TaxID=2033586 RepID=UPI001CCE0BB2|nr:NADH-quinone oxidoreductase subunit NuoE [Afifella sp. IM 167]MBZ8132269.1 NADH-quinone oxidoreductase subunit NuoE [Afifella sp. IM 167]
MAVRRLAEVQPENFAFSQDNSAWAEREIAKYPPGRQASAVIALLWRAQEQEGWVSEPAIETVADMLDMPKIRVLEVATFYTMFHLAPVGRKAHVQVCGTTPCMLRGAEDIKKVCRNRIAHDPHEVSADGDFSWEEVECLGACVNAPMVQIFSDTYEDLTPESFGAVLDAFARGETPTPGPQNDRQFGAPLSGPTTLNDVEGGSDRSPREWKASPAPAHAQPAQPEGKASVGEKEPHPANETTAGGAPEEPQQDVKGSEKSAAKNSKAEKAARPSRSGRADEEAARSDPSDAASSAQAAADEVGSRPKALAEPEGEKDDLKKISGVGPVLEEKLHGLGIWHFHQIAAWSDEEVAWVGTFLSFPGRIERDDWIGQAKSFSAGRGKS